MIWDRLTKLQETIIHALDTSPGIERTREPGMDRFHRDEWTNITWSGRGIRRAHMDVVDARDTKGLWMMHVCIMPTLGSDAPIYGFDVIAGKNKITGAFLDYSTTTNADHPMMEVFSHTVEHMQWKKERELPVWAKSIFSDNMVAAGNLTDEFEVEQICHLAKVLLWYYVDTAYMYEGRSVIELSAASQNYYARRQKMNPHTPRVMKSLGLPEDDVGAFIQDCLFPEIKDG
jgi:phycocyanobilin:ferredoxin oxidoreductase